MCHPDNSKGTHRQEGTYTPNGMHASVAAGVRSREGTRWGWGHESLHGEVNWNQGESKFPEEGRREAPRKYRNLRWQRGGRGRGRERVRVHGLTTRFGTNPAIENQLRSPIVAERLNRVEGRSKFSAERGDSSSLGRRRAAEHHHPAEKRVGKYKRIITGMKPPKKHGPHQLLETAASKTRRARQAMTARPCLYTRSLNIEGRAS